MTAPDEKPIPADLSTLAWKADALFNREQVLRAQVQVQLATAADARTAAMAEFTEALTAAGEIAAGHTLVSIDAEKMTFICEPEPRADKSTTPGRKRRPRPKKR